MTQPLTIRADTPRDAVEEVCKWLEEFRGGASSVITRPDDEDFRDGMDAGLNDAARILRSAIIEPKEQADAS
jgi:hypothetical protein